MTSPSRHPVRTAVFAALAMIAAIEVSLIVLWRRQDERTIHTAGRLYRATINRLALLFAGKPHSMYAVIEHAGRRTGRTYQTPVIVTPAPGAFLISLPFGDRTDWYRNLVAAGSARIYWQGGTYTVGRPEPANKREAAPFFSLPVRAALRIYGVNRFVRLPIITQAEQAALPPRHEATV